MSDVAARAGVSASTVSNYLHRPTVVRPATRERIFEAIEALRYVPNHNARQLRSGRSRTIALMLLDAWIPFYAELSRGVEDVALAGDWTVLFSNTKRDPERERRNLDVFESQRVQGMLIVPEGRLESRLVELQRAGMGCVVVEESDPPEDISSVSVDDVLGGELAAEHLWRSGRRRLAFVGDPHVVRHVAERWKGFSSRLADLSSQVAATVKPKDLTMAAGVRAVQDLVRLPAAVRPEGVFAANDTVALGILQGCLQLGVRVPDDLAIVGFDDIEFASFAAIPLTTIKQPAYQLGATAAAVLIEEMEGGLSTPPKHLVFEPELVIRESAP